MGNAQKGFKSNMINVLITVGVFYLALVMAMYLLQRNFLYYPDNFTPTPEQSGVSEMQEVRFLTEDGLELFAWTAEPRDPGKPWVVLFHGNAGSIGSRGFKARMFLDAGFGVMLVEYRGYGGNPGAPTETGLMADGRAALAYLAEQGVSGDDLVLYGESLGTGVAVAMAAEAAGHGKPVRAVLLEAPFTSAAAAGAKHYPFMPVKLLMKDRYDSLSRIKAIEAPLFIAHGEDDWTVPASLGHQLFDAALEPKQSLWVPGAGHNDLFTYGVGMAAIQFIKQHSR